MSGKDVNVGEQKGYRDGFNADGSKDEDMMGILNNKNYDGNGGPQITAGMINAQYGVETVLMAVLASVIFSLFVGFITGYFCGRRCHKDEDDNLPYPDTEYEYFEQRQNINR
jgi:semaphorin 6